MEEKCFNYKYSSDDNREVMSIKKKYMPKEETKLEKLKALDRRVSMAGRIEAITVGIIGCLIFGIGMCFGLDVFSGADYLTVIFCAIGAIVMLPAYRIYKHISTKTKSKLTPQIISISDEIIKY